MSYDFLVWSGPVIRDPDEVHDLIEAVCEGNLDVLDQCPRIGEFLSNLFDEYPPLGSSNPRAHAVELYRRYFRATCVVECAGRFAECL